MVSLEKEVYLFLLNHSKLRKEEYSLMLLLGNKSYFAQIVLLAKYSMNIAKFLCSYSKFQV